jgi:hypothetical protein
MERPDHPDARGGVDPAPDPDPDELNELLVESRDLHRDAMVTTTGALDDLVELGQDRRSVDGIEPDAPPAADGAGHGASSRVITFGGGLLAAAGIAAALDAVTAGPAFASSPDVRMLQTAASIEVLAVATYKTALTLPFIGGSAANPVVKAFATTTMQQHQEHLDAFNAAVTRLGGTAQTDPDPVLAKVVQAAVPGLTSPVPVVALALELEQGAAETYVADVAALSDAESKKVTASIMGVEAQHVSVLLAVQALLAAGDPQLVTLSPTDVAGLPAAAGSVGFPNAFFPTDMARDPGEGALS